MELQELITRWDSNPTFGAVVRRIVARVNIVEGGCWECTYAKDTSGYPQISVNGVLHNGNR